MYVFNCRFTIKLQIYSRLQSDLLISEKKMLSKEQIKD